LSLVALGPADRFALGYGAREIISRRHRVQFDNERIKPPPVTLANITVRTLSDEAEEKAAHLAERKIIRAGVDLPCCFANLRVEVHRDADGGVP